MVNSSPPVNPQGEAVKKTLLYLGAGSAQTDSNCCDSESVAGVERGRGRREEGEGEGEGGVFATAT